MGEKHLVCQGAICMCKFGAVPDKLMVRSHSKEYINDSEGVQKMIASTMDLGPTFERNSFGVCTKIRGTCSASVTSWSGFYKEVTLAHQGKILLEDSKATCPVGGTDCIEIIFHGQTIELTQMNLNNADDDALGHLYPCGSLKEKKKHKVIPND